MAKLVDVEAYAFELPPKDVVTYSKEIQTEAPSFEGEGTDAESERLAMAIAQAAAQAAEKANAQAALAIQQYKTAEEKARESERPENKVKSTGRALPYGVAHMFH